MLRKQKSNAGVVEKKSVWDEKSFWHRAMNTVETKIYVHLSIKLLQLTIKIISKMHTRTQSHFIADNHIALITSSDQTPAAWLARQLDTISAITLF